jgi:KDO2-lipid IV(A) lauroyltransferase
LRISLKISYRLAVFVSDLHYFISKNDRVAVMNNLAVIFPDIDKKELSIHARGVFRNFGKYLVDFFYLLKFDENFIRNKVLIEGREYIDQALSRGKGAIIVSAHIGNWELGGVALASMGYPIFAIALPHKNKRVDNFFNQQREKRGLRVIPLGNAAHRCLENLKNNKILGILGDRVFASHGIILNFFGKPTLIPKGPTTFSLTCDSPLIAGFILREKDNSFKFIFHKPIEYQPCGNKNEDLKNITKNYLDIIEDYIRKYPEQWFMFREFWIK